MTSAAKATKGMLWLVGGRFGSAMLSIVSTAVLARLLTPGDFGIIAAAVVVLALANVLFDGAFGINLIRKTVLRQEDLRTTLTAGLTLSAAFVVIVILAAPALEKFFGFPGLALILSICSVIIPFKATFAIAAAKLQRDGRFNVIATASLLGQFAGYILLAVPLSLSGAGVWSLATAMILAGLVEACITASFARLSFRFAWDSEALRDVRSASLFSVANIMNWIANSSPNVIVGRFLGASDLGLYSRGWKLLDLVVHSTATPLDRILLPSFAKLSLEENRLRSAFLSVLGLIIPFYAVASVILTFQAPMIVELVLGDQWVETVPVAAILFATLVPRCAFKASETFAFAIGKSMAAALRQAIYALLMVSSCLVGASFGIRGVAFGVFAAIFGFYAISMTYAVRIGHMDPMAVITIHLKALLLSCMAALADFSVLYFLHDVHLFVKHVAAGLLATLLSVAIVCISPSFWLGNTNTRHLKRVLDLIQSNITLKRFMRFRG